MEAMIGNNSQPNSSNSKPAPTKTDSSSQVQNHAEKETRTVIALQTMIEWLCERPSELLSSKLSVLLQRLRQCNRNSVLIEITHGTIEKLLLTLPSSCLQSSIENIFFFLLLGFQHSETVFHQITTALPNIFQELLKKVESPIRETKPLVEHVNTGSHTKKILKRLQESVRFLIYKFPGFAQLYDPLSEWLDPVNTLSKERIAELESLSWLSTYNTSWCGEKIHDSLSSNQHVNSSSVMDQSVTNWSGITSVSLARDLANLSPKYSTKRRSATGMVGLINLGNTCYMNSILQALYITDMFRELVFMAPVQASSQKVLDKLQQTFAFLKNTMRAIYSPSEFLKAARPPWFESGRQQDCSEFLKFLLDSLHEQEKSQKGEDVCVYGEHQIIEASIETADKNENVGDETDDFAQTPTNEIPENVTDTTTFLASGHLNTLTGTVKGIRASYSNTALDSISEAPEMIDDVDEDMISQGSAAAQGEDLLFGSRGSLSTETNKILFEPDLSDDSEDEDGKMGSRNSLGLMRWTTEDNLSFGGSKEQMDLMEGTTINDSHSNSTDSGIQSVGDSSIRGSSDSMSNQAAPTNGETASLGNPKNLNDHHNKFRCGEGLPTSQTQTPFVSLVQKVFGGKMQTSYQCYNCNSISIHKEYFTDLLLAFPDPKGEEEGNKSSNSNKERVKENDGNVQPKETKTPETSNISIQQLVDLYLRPEKLTGENQYHCNKCKSLQDCNKTMKILEGPEHLICTLMRFKYDRTLNRKSKVFTDVKYDLSLSIQAERCNDSNANSRDTNNDEKNELIDNNCDKNAVKNSGHSQTDLTQCGDNDAHATSTPPHQEEVYKLYAIVVHSGYSSDGGHYFTYAKVPKKPEQSQDSETTDDLWYIFNDSKVTYSNFESFLNLSKKFPVDTAYVLFYQKVNKCTASSTEEAFTTLKEPLRKNLKMVVERDNIKFMREKERSAALSSSVGHKLTKHGKIRKIITWVSSSPSWLLITFVSFIC